MVFCSNVDNFLYMDICRILIIVIILMISIFRKLPCNPYCKTNALRYISRDYYCLTIIILFMIIPLYNSILYYYLNLICSETLMIYVLIRMYILQILSIMYIVYIIIYIVYSNHNHRRWTKYNEMVSSKAIWWSLFFGCLFIIIICAICIVKTIIGDPALVSNIYIAKVAVKFDNFSFNDYMHKIAILSILAGAILSFFIGGVLKIYSGATRYKIAYGQLYSNIIYMIFNACCYVSYIYLLYIIGSMISCAI